MAFKKDSGAGALREIWYRSGAAARLAGLPVETLRVWERRYGLSDTERSSRGQRLYSEEQVKRLGLLKQLVDQGHPIGQLATLSLEQLRALAGAGSADGAAAPAGPMRLAVAGIGLARRIAASNQQSRLEVVASWSRLDEAVATAGPVAADLLVVELSELHEAAIAAIAAARDATGSAAVMVLYRFSASATIRALRAQGWLVARVPAEIGELVSLCRSALAGGDLPPPRAEPEAAPAPRFDEHALATISNAGNSLACECPRHLADLLLMVGSFERYSAQCASRNEADRLLHEELYQAAGRARAVLEQAMEQLAQAEGLPLPEQKK
ncbi:hypothetical protein GCM10027277_58460 [Pseudoduganella ginsengisoli]|uniref:MerR family transcriptional regulator n=1 Tax=Pseudoduganella ginsengisoli TaxID=1462440 RepID=A0A6L6Q909_9BURK|nr:MerR family transcriptional regulator [Pseudoduganella ginsengisoli]MTW06140.1 MerR family transcriptional regulator [Pseudoduganella ginsengisoli]